MDYYEAWFNLKNTSKDLEFTKRMRQFMSHLEEKGLIQGYKLTRRKLGFGPLGLGEFHVTIECEEQANGCAESRSSENANRATSSSWPGGKL